MTRLEVIKSLKQDIAELEQKRLNIEAIALSECRELTDSEEKQDARLYIQINALTEHLEELESDSMLEIEA